MHPNLLDRALNFIGLERRMYNAQDPSWSHPLLQGGSVTTARAESLSTVYACVSAISETIASLPLILYRRTADDGRERAPDHPLYRVLHDQPNAIQKSPGTSALERAVRLPFITVINFSKNGRQKILS